MRKAKLFNLNEEVIKEFDESVPKFYRSRVMDVLMIRYLIEEAETSSNLDSNSAKGDNNE
jgi:hypothetical protein